MKRRTFIALLGGAAVGWPLAARTQQPATPVIGFLNNTSPEIRRVELAAFHRGLKEGGYVEGQNVRMEYRWAQGRYDRLPALAGDLAQASVSVLVATGGEQVALAAKAATATIPTVFIIAGDPVKIGLVASLNRPGGNVTGFSLLDTLTEAKRLEVAHELVPGAPLIAFLVNPDNPITESVTRDLQAAADTLGRKLLVVGASTGHELDAAFANAAQQRAGAVLLEGDGFLFGERARIVALAAMRGACADFARASRRPAMSASRCRRLLNGLTGSKDASSRGKACDPRNRATTAIELAPFRLLARFRIARDATGALQLSCEFERLSGRLRGYAVGLEKSQGSQGLSAAPCGGTLD